MGANILHAFHNPVQQVRKLHSLKLCDLRYQGTNMFRSTAIMQHAFRDRVPDKFRYYTMSSGVLPAKAPSSGLSTKHLQKSLESMQSQR
jgi:hypothetical protein